MDYHFHFIIGTFETDYEHYNICCNYSKEELTKAFYEVENILGFNLSELCQIPGEDYIEPDKVNILVKHKVLKQNQVVSKEESDGTDIGFYYFKSIDDFVELIFNCIKLVLPDLKWGWDGDNVLDFIDGLGIGLFNE